MASRESEEESVASANPATETTPPTHIELHLLRLLLLHDELLPWAARHLDVKIWIMHAQVRRIVDLRLAAQEHQTWDNLAQFLDGCETAEQRSLVTESAAEDRKIPNPAQQLNDVTLKLRNSFLDRRIADCLLQAGQPGISEPEKITLLREQQQLRELKRSDLPPRSKRKDADNPALTFAGGLPNIKIELMDNQRNLS